MQIVIADHEDELQFIYRFEAGEELCSIISKFGSVTVDGCLR